MEGGGAWGGGGELQHQLGRGSMGVCTEEESPMGQGGRVDVGFPRTPSHFPALPFCCRFWFRLYWFPLKVLYATSHCSLRSVPDIPFYFFFNALLLLLTLMNLYWFLVSGRCGPDRTVGAWSESMVRAWPGPPPPPHLCAPLVTVHRGLCHQGADGSNERAEGRAGVRRGRRSWAHAQQS